jgi:hypothetical protein
VIEAVQECATKTEVEAFRADFSAFRAEVQDRFDVLTAEVARKADGAALSALERRLLA